MIDLGRAALVAEGVTVFPDHADPSLFHYLPRSPRLALAEDGTPELSLLEYRLDPALHEALGAGMLSLTVDLAVAAEVLDRLALRLQRMFDLRSRPRLAPVAADAGRCELVLVDRASETPAPATSAVVTPAAVTPAEKPLSEAGSTAPAGPEARAAAPGDGPAMVERIVSGAAPSLYGDNEATFMAVLSAEGVALVEAALRGGGLPAGVLYHLDVLGLRPALRAQITARWDDVYRYYENRLHGGKLLLATDIGKTVEELVHAEAITIEVDELVPASERDATYDRTLAQAQAYVVEQLFKPTLGQAPPAEDTHEGALATIGSLIKDVAGFFTLTYSLREISRSELKTFTYRLDVASAEKLTLSPQGTLALMLARAEGEPRVDVDTLIHVVPPSASREMTFDVGASVSLASEAIDRIEAIVRYGDREEHLVLDTETPRRKVTFWYDEAAGLAVRHTFEVHFLAGESGPAAVLRSAEAATESRVLRLDPRELYRHIEVRAVAQGVPFDRFPSVIVDLAATDATSGWSGAQTLVLDAAHAEASWRLRAAPDASVRVQSRLRYVGAGGQESLVDWDVVEPGILVVGDPFPSVLDVQIAGSARFDTEVRRLIVELRMAAAPEQVATRVLTREQPFATWSVLLADRDARAYEYRVTVHTIRSEVREGRWLPGSGGALIVGEGIARLRQVKLLFVGKSFKDLGLIGVKVRFAFEDAEASLHAEDEVLVQDAKESVTWSYPVADPSRQAYSYQLTRIHADGQMDVSEAVVASDLLLVCPLI